MSRVVLSLAFLVALPAAGLVHPTTAHNPAAESPTAQEPAGQTPTTPKAGAQSRPFEPVTDAVLRNQPPGDWLRWRRDHGATGYSPLDQINRGNVQKLRLAWSWAMQPGVQEQEPIVHNGIMYLPHSNS